MNDLTKTELALIEAWDQAVEKRDYELSLTLLEDWLRGQTTFATPFARHVITLQALSVNWAGRMTKVGPLSEGLADACCSFCGKKHDAVHKLIAGPGSFICDECIRMFASSPDVRNVSKAKPAGLIDCCSFCGKENEGKEGLIAGENALICRSCVAVCAKVLKAENEPR